MASSKSNGIEPTDWARGPTVTGPAWERFLKAIYNPQEKSFLGRTAKRWGILFIFYGVFYAVLAALFAACMGGLYRSLDKHRPTYILRQSLIGENPGVAFRPLPDTVIPLGFAVQYDKSNYTHYTKHLKDFLNSTEMSEKWSECLESDNYGFPDTPCFYIKLNKIYGWEPQYYDDIDALPNDMPADLTEYIKGETSIKEKIWISCEEEKGNTTKIDYPWGRSLPGSSFPYTNVVGYRSPIVAVKLHPPINEQVIIRCRAWAKNIVYSKSIKEPSGYTRIILIVKDTNQSHTNTTTE